MAKVSIKDTMIVKAELLSGDEKKSIVISLPNGSKVVGRSLGIEYEEGEDGEYHDVLAFLFPDLEFLPVFPLLFRDNRSAYGRS